MKFTRALATTLITAILLGSSVITSGCYCAQYSKDSYKKIESESEKIAKQFCDDSGYKLKDVEVLTNVGEYGNIYLTTYSEFTYKDGNVTNKGVINADTKEIYTSEHIDDFRDVVEDFVKDELDISAKEIEVAVRLDNVKTKYVTKTSDTAFFEKNLLPAELDSYDEYMDYLYDSKKDDNLCLTIKGSVDDSFELGDLGFDYRKDLRDEYNITFNLDLTNSYESFHIEDSFCNCKAYETIEVDNIKLLVAYKRTFCNAIGNNSCNEYDIDDLISDITIKKTKNGFKFSLDNEKDYINEFRIVADEGDEILEATYKDTSRDLTLSWNEIDDGSYISKAIYRFDVEFEKVED